ncbi:hypothetical protein J6590_047070 [Homalodisca vitripennis]|nr:hypothetical protein J6590_047070 [Homalodisca vitripennis]
MNFSQNAAITIPDFFYLILYCTPLIERVVAPERSKPQHRHRWRVVCITATRLYYCALYLTVLCSASYFVITSYRKTEEIVNFVFPQDNTQSYVGYGGFPERTKFCDSSQFWGNLCHILITAPSSLGDGDRSHLTSTAVNCRANNADGCFHSRSPLQEVQTLQIDPDMLLSQLTGFCQVLLPPEVELTGSHVAEDTCPSSPVQDISRAINIDKVARVAPPLTRPLAKTKSTRSDSCSRFLSKFHFQRVLFWPKIPPCVALGFRVEAEIFEQ